VSTAELIPAGLSGVESAADITQVDNLKLIELGEPGVGKSWLTCTGRQPIYVCDFDDRKLSIAGKPGVFIKQYVDRDPLMPHSWSDFESDIGTFEYAKSKGELQFKTIAIASLTYALKAAQSQLMKDNSGLCRTIKVGSIKYIITQGWDAVTVAQKMVEGILNRLFELKIDIIVEAHIRREKDPSSTPEKSVFTDKFTIEPQNLKMLLPMFNERWLVTNDYGDYKVITKPNSVFNAVTALHIDGEETCNITDILAKHATNVAAGK
jgi:hypothetical protein